MDAGEAVEAWVSFGYSLPQAAWSVRPAVPGDTGQREILVERNLSLDPVGSFSPPVSDDLAGRLPGIFRGSYRYDGRDGEYPFVIKILEDGGRISGFIEEPGSNVGGAGDTVTSAIGGTLTGNTLSFRKIYDDNGEEVLYSGEYDPKTGEITGRWEIAELQGSFSITLPPSAARP